MIFPKDLGYFFPAEWAPHAATWLSWPHNENSWPGKLQEIYPHYSEFIRVISLGERVCINVSNAKMQEEAEGHLEKAGVDLSQIAFFIHPTNDAWCRDHGPAFLVSKDSGKSAIVKWNYNAWGGKYPPYDLDNEIPLKIATHLGLPVFKPGIIMEGGSVDFNGEGTVLTTTSCLLNPNRNLRLSQDEIEEYLKGFYGVQQVIWLGNGIVGDDTDGHIDDITRFVSKDTVITVIEKDPSNPNYEPLQKNRKALEGIVLANGSALKVIELPMPSLYEEDGQIFPCSYANFYICNAAVIVPTFQDKMDDVALEILSDCFKDRQVIGIPSKEIIWGLGSFHCLSQQQPS